MKTSSLLLISGILAMSISACNSGGGSSSSLPNSPLQVIPNAINFTSNQPTQSVTITNTSSNTVNLLTPSITTPLSLESTTCSSILAANSSCSYTFASSTTNGGHQVIKINASGYQAAALTANYDYIHYAYVATGDLINICNLDTNMKLNDCIAIPSPIISLTGVVLDPQGKNMYLSSENVHESNIASCNMTNNHLLGKCITQSYSTAIKGLALNSTTLYLAGLSVLSGEPTIKCELTDEMLGTCSKAQIVSTINAPQSSPIIASNGYFYALGIDNNHYPLNYMQRCNISPKNNMLIDCQQTGGLLGHNNFPAAGGMAINNSSTFAYVLISTNRHIDDSISICPIDSSGNISTTCVSTPAQDANGQNTLVLGSRPFNPTIFNNTLFIPNKDSNTVSACPLKQDGSLGVCTVSTLTQGTRSPSSVWVY